VDSIFEDGQRLKQLDLAVNHGRHHHLQIDHARTRKLACER